jgi:hypothetical protein
MSDETRCTLYDCGKHTFHGVPEQCPWCENERLTARIEADKEAMAELVSQLAAAKRECEGLTQDIASWKLTAQRLDDKLAAAKREWRSVDGAWFAGKVVAWAPMPRGPG